VGLRTRMRLHVHMLGFEQRFGAVDRELLHLVHDFTAAVVPLLGEPLGVLVGERRAHGLHDGHGGEVLARDQLEPVLLALHLPLDQRVDARVGLREARASINHDPSWSILATRRAWRPPSNPLSSHRYRVSIPSSSLTNRDGSTSTFASLCLRA